MSPANGNELQAGSRYRVEAIVGRDSEGPHSGDPVVAVAIAGLFGDW